MLDNIPIMKDKITFVLYLISIFTISCIHNYFLLLGLIIVLFFISIPKTLKILKKTLISIILFNSFISITYMIKSLLENNQNWLETIVLINLRVFLLTYLTFYVLNHINLFKVFSFSKDFMYLITLAYSQILTFKKSFIDFKISLQSRTIEKPTFINLYNSISFLFLSFFNKSLKNSENISQAMRSRGFFND